MKSVIIEVINRCFVEETVAQFHSPHSQILSCIHDCQGLLMSNSQVHEASDADFLTYLQIFLTFVSRSFYFKRDAHINTPVASNRCWQ